MWLNSLEIRNPSFTSVAFYTSNKVYGNQCFVTKVTKVRKKRHWCLFMVWVDSLSLVLISICQTTIRPPPFCSLSNWHKAQISTYFSSKLKRFKADCKQTAKYATQDLLLSKGFKCENLFNRRHIKYRKLCCATLLHYFVTNKFNIKRGDESDESNSDPWFLRAPLWETRQGGTVYT